MTLRPHEVAALATVIERLREFQGPADATLRSFFRAHPGLGKHERGFVADGAFAFLRRLRSLEWLAGSKDPRRLALVVAVRELRFPIESVRAIAKREDSAWLATLAAREREPMPPAVQADLPDWLWQRLGALWGDARRAAFARAAQAEAPLDLRVNAIRATREQAIAALATSHLVAVPTKYSPWGLRIDGRPALTRLPVFEQGAVEVQDEGSQLVALLVAPKRHDFVVDFCAGAGGKTLALGALMRSQGRLYAFDVSDRRLANLKPRLARSGLTNVQAQRIEHERDTRIKRLAGKADRVLVDAPCTGLGTLRRNPDLKWRQDETALAELCAKQRAILAGAATLVKPGGRLVYATCSVLPEENEAIVEAFLRDHPQFTAGTAAAELARAGVPLDTGPTLRLATETHGCDGFFAALLERSG